MLRRVFKLSRPIPVTADILPADGDLQTLKLRPMRQLPMGWTDAGRPCLYRFRADLKRVQQCARHLRYESGSGAERGNRYGARRGRDSSLNIGPCIGSPFPLPWVPATDCQWET